VEVWGNDDDSIHQEALCVWILGEEDTVIGVIGEGTTKEIVANWESPFEDSSLGSMFKKIGGMVQKITDMTSLTALSSVQTWGGNEPYLIDLVLKLYALSDPWQEVEGAILALEKMIAPDINFAQPGGRVPQPVMIHLGRHQIIQDCYIKSMSVPLDKERTSMLNGGYLMRADVNLQVGTIKMVTRSDLGGMVV